MPPRGGITRTLPRSVRTAPAQVVAPGAPGAAFQSMPSSRVEPVSSIWRSRFRRAGQVKVVKSTDRSGMTGTLSSVIRRSDGVLASAFAVAAR